MTLGRVTAGRLLALVSGPTVEPAVEAGPVVVREALEAIYTLTPR